MAYGARLESVLGASPRGFESPILRHRTPGPVEVPGFLCICNEKCPSLGRGVVPPNQGYRTLRVAGRLTFRLIDAGKSVF